MIVQPFPPGQSKHFPWSDKGTVLWLVKGQTFGYTQGFLWLVQTLLAVPKGPAKRLILFGLPYILTLGLMKDSLEWPFIACGLSWQQEVTEAKEQQQSGSGDSLALVNSAVETNTIPNAWELKKRQKNSAREQTWQRRQWKYTENKEPEAQDKRILYGVREEKLQAHDTGHLLETCQTVRTGVSDTPASKLYYWPMSRATKSQHLSLSGIFNSSCC